MQTEWISPLLAWLVTASLRASAIAAGVLLLHTVIGRRLPARWRFALWTPFVLVLLFPVLPDSPLSAARLWRAEAAPVADAPGGLERTGGSGAAAIDGTGRVAAHSGLTGSSILTGIWLAGAGVLVLCGSLSWRGRMRRIRAASVPASAALRAAVEEACAATGLRKMPELLCSREVGSPAVTGPWRPVLLLPARFPDALEERQAGLILAHECVHLKRRDTTWDLLFWLTGAVYWFNPLIALAISRLRADRELARDAEVLAGTGMSERRAYGEALLQLAQAGCTPGYQIGFTGLVSTRGRMRNRISCLAAHRRVPVRWHAAGLLLAASLHLLAGDAKPPAVPARLPGDAAIAKARTIRLAEVRFENAGIDEVVDYLRRRSVELDKTPDASNPGVDFVLRLTGSEAPKVVKLDLKEVSLYDAAVAAAEAAGMTVSASAEENALFIAAAAEQKKGAAGDGKSAVRTLAETIVVDELRLEGADLRTAVAFLKAKAKERDPAGKGIAIEIVPGAGNGRKATMTLRDATVWALARSLADMCGCGVRAEGSTLYFVPAGKK